MVPKNPEGEHLCPIEIAQQFEGETRIVSLLKSTMVAQSITFGIFWDFTQSLHNHKIAKAWSGMVRLGIPHFRTNPNHIKLVSYISVYTHSHQEFPVASHPKKIEKQHPTKIAMNLYGSVSKPCTPGEHQNSW